MAETQAAIAIEGVGLITPLGVGAWETFTALLAGRSIADRNAALPAGVDLASRVRAVGAVASVQHVAADPAVELAERAVREACTASGISAAGLRGFIGTSKGAIATAWRLGGGDARADRRAVTLGPCGYLSDELRRRVGLGLAEHHVAACASGLTALDAARRWLIDQPIGTTCVVASCESALLPAFIHSYRRLGVLADEAHYACRPLDRRRGGFMLAELGAAVVLRRVGALRPRSIVLLDTAVACEAYDLIRPSPSMPALRRVAGSLLGGHAVEVVHPHAPGTAEHDAMELRLLRELAGDDTVVYANKGALGHGLGAAGLASLVIAWLCLRTQRTPPMPWLDQPIAAGLSRDGAALRGGGHAVFAMGFGGHVAAALIGPAQ